MALDAPLETDLEDAAHAHGINVSLVSSKPPTAKPGHRYISELENALRIHLRDGVSLVRMGDSHNRLRQWPPARLAWEQTVLAMNARRERLDVLHSPVNVVPWPGEVPASS